MTKPNRWVRLFVVTLFLAVGAALAVPGASAQSSGRSQQWIVIRAEYGYRARRTDVTDLLRDLLSRGGVNGRIAVNNQTMGGDPAVGKDKTLRIFARDRDGDQRQFDFREGSSIPVDMFAVRGRGLNRRDNHNGFGDRDGRDQYRDRDRDRRRRLEILWGFYGVQGRTANVTGLLQSMVDHGRLRVAVNNRTMGGDPARGANKVLIVVYRFRGVEQATAVPEGRLLSIP